MDAGQLDQQISIQSRTVTQDELGADVEGWITTSEPWAKVIETPGREFLKGEFQAEGKGRGRIYTIEDVTGTMREGYCWLHCKSVAGVN
jgi:head-tail adaptor